LNCIASNFVEEGIAKGFTQFLTLGHESDEVSHSIDAAELLLVELQLAETIVIALEFVEEDFLEEFGDLVVLPEFEVLIHLIFDFVEPEAEELHVVLREFRSDFVEVEGELHDIEGESVDSVVNAGIAGGRLVMFVVVDEHEQREALPLVGLCKLLWIPKGVESTGEVSQVFRIVSACIEDSIQNFLWLTDALSEFDVADEGLENSDVRLEAIGSILLTF
jgi:hypothetical protein